MYTVQQITLCTQHITVFIRWTQEAVAISNCVVKEGRICITAFPWNHFWINVNAGVRGLVVKLIAQ